VPLTP